MLHRCIVDSYRRVKFPYNWWMPVVALQTLLIDLRVVWPLTLDNALTATVWNFLGQVVLPSPSPTVFLICLTRIAKKKRKGIILDTIINHHCSSYWHLLSVKETCRWICQKYHQTTSCSLRSYMQCFLGIYVMRASNQGLTPKKVLDSNYYISSLHTEDQLFSSFIGVRTLEGVAFLLSYFSLKYLKVPTWLADCSVKKWLWIL